VWSRNKLVSDNLAALKKRKEKRDKRKRHEVKEAEACEDTRASLSKAKAKLEDITKENAEFCASRGANNAQVADAAEQDSDDLQPAVLLSSYAFVVRPPIPTDNTASMNVPIQLPCVSDVSIGIGVGVMRSHSVRRRPRLWTLRRWRRRGMRTCTTTPARSSLRSSWLSNQDFTASLSRTPSSSFASARPRLPAPTPLEFKCSQPEAAARAAVRSHLGQETNSIVIDSRCSDLRAGMASVRLPCAERSFRLPPVASPGTHS
jgi:hypothetical protein